MGKTRSQKNRNNKRNDRKNKLAARPKKQKQRQRLRSNPVQDDDPALFGEGASYRDEDPSASLSNPDQIHRLLEPYTKDQLIGFLLDAITADATLFSKIRSMADHEVAHRKVFVHGLGWDTTREILIQAFEPCGPIEDCNVIVDKATGRTKGFGFVVFRTRAGAAKALKQPQRKIKNRVAYCQLASVGPVPSPSAADTSGRKVYISNVHADTASDELKAFFSQFGEIEKGPYGFDMLSGKSRGYAIFVYKTLEGARRALEEPYKMFQGQKLHCKLAIEHGSKGKAPALAPNPTAAAALLGATQQPVLAAVAAAQNLALYSQNPAAYSSLLAQNPLFAAAALNPAVAAAASLNPAASLLASQGKTIGGTGGGSGSPTMLGVYGSQALAGLQGLQSYQGLQFGQSSMTKPSGSYQGFP